MDQRSNTGNRTNDTVTVLIAAYNAAPFLHRAVDSALRQTKPPLEILIIDDASTDDTLAVANRLGQTNPLIRVMPLAENGGPAKARNVGLDAARGDWVAILDADDAFLPERLERLTDIGNAAKADIVTDNFLWYDANMDTIGAPGISASHATETIDMYRFIERAKPFTDEADWGLLKPIFKRNFLDENHLRYPLFSRHGEDLLLMLNSFLGGAHYVLTRTPGYLYTNRASGLSRTKIDYDSMATHTADFLRQDRIRTDKQLKKLLRQRVDALRRLSSEHKIRRHLSNRNFKRIAYMLFDLWMLRTVFRFGWQKTIFTLKNKSARLTAADKNS